MHLGNGGVVIVLRLFEASGGIPHFIAELDVEFQIGIQRRPRRIRLWAGIRIDPIGAVLTEQGQLVDVIIGRPFGDIDP